MESRSLRSFSSCERPIELKPRDEQKMKHAPIGKIRKITLLVSDRVGLVSRRRTNVARRRERETEREGERELELGMDQTQLSFDYNKSRRK